MKKRSAGIAAGIALWLTPAAALACPYCAGRSGGGIAQGIAIGLFVMFPFVVALTVYRVIKAGEPKAARVEKSAARIAPRVGEPARP